MALTKPILQEISTFSSINEKEITFQVFAGSQVVYNELEIQNNSNNTQVYLEKIQSFQFVHKVPANSLQNGIEYRARIRTYDVDNTTPSEWSDWVVFWCVDIPVVDVINITDGKINNQTYVFQGSYTQTHDSLQSYRYKLFDMNKVLIRTFDEKFDGLLQQEITNLQNKQPYYIELITISTLGMLGSSGLILFVPDYIQPKLATVLNLSNRKDQAAIQITANIIQIIFDVKSGTYVFEDGEWINLKNGAIFAQEGLTMPSDFTLKLWCKNLPIGDEFLRIIGAQGDISCRFFDNRVHLYKTINNGLNYHIASNTIATPAEHDILFIGLQQVGNYCNITCQTMT